MFIYEEKFNPFLKDDLFFHYCDQPYLNLVLFYKRTEQWNLVRETLKIVLNDYSERKRIGETEMFVKILGYKDRSSTAEDLIEKNRAFLGGRTLAMWLNESDRNYVLYAYIDLGRYYLKHSSPDYAYICYQEILQGEIEIDLTLNLTSLEGIGNTYEMKGEYPEAIIWWKNVIDADINGTHTSMFQSPTIRLYHKILCIYNEQLKDPLSSIVCMKEIIHTLIRKTDRIDEIYDIVATIYKMTIHFYHQNDNSSSLKSNSNQSWTMEKMVVYWLNMRFGEI